MALSAQSPVIRTLAAMLTALAAILCAIVATSQPIKPALQLGDSATATSHDASIRELRDGLPTGLRDAITAPTAEGARAMRWVSLPPTLDGRVRLAHSVAADAPGRAGWTMLDTPASARRVNVDRGALYRTAAYDVLQIAEVDRLREYIAVNERQGVRTWRWKLFGATPSTRPALRADGTVALGNGIVLQPPALFDAELTKLGMPVEWKLAGDILSLTFDDTSLALPYIIDPDAVPTIKLIGWSESSPYAHYDSALGVSELFFNPTKSGTATARVSAIDDVSVKHVAWPTPPSGWSPPAGNGTSPISSDGIEGQYFEGGTYFSGTTASRIDPNIDFTWPSGTRPFSFMAGSGAHSTRWSGELLAPETGTYYFQTDQDSGMYVWLDVDRDGAFGTSEFLVGVNNNTSTKFTSCQSSVVSLNAGHRYPIKVEYINSGGGARAILRWKVPSDTTSSAPSANCYAAGTQKWAAISGSTVWTGSTYPIVPPSAFKLTGGEYTRAFTWTSGATGGTRTVGAEDSADQSASPAASIDFVPDATAPTTSGTTSLNLTGWINSDAAVTMTYPSITSVTDSGSGVAGSRIERMDGVGNGTGACDFGASTWATVLTNPTGTSKNHVTLGTIPAGTCAKFRWIAFDNVGNEIIQETLFKGNDTSSPLNASMTITPKSGLSYQHVVSSPPSPYLGYVYFNPEEAGRFDVTMTGMSDPESGIDKVVFPTLANAGWSSPSPSDVPSPGPYVGEYEWVGPGATAPGTNVNVGYQNGVGRTTNARMAIVADTSVPTYPGSTFTHPTGWSQGPVNLTLSGAMSDGGSGLRHMIVQREQAPLTGSTCGAYTGSSDPASNLGWTTLPSMPVTTLSNIVDNGVAAGTCYRYRVLGVDNVGNIGERTRNLSQEVMIDKMAPTGTITNPASGDSVGGTINVQGTAMDDYAGFASGAGTRAQLFYRAPGDVNEANWTLIGNVSTGFPAGWSYPLNTGSLNGVFDLVLKLEDRAGNQSTVVASNVIVDNTPPTLSFDTFVPATGPAHYYPGSGATIFVRGAAAGTPPVPGTGSFIARFNASDAGSGVAKVTFPAVAPNTGGQWTPAAITDVATPPYELEYTWGEGSNSPASESVTATDKAGRVSPAAVITITTDNTAPSYGGTSFSYTNGWYKGPVAVSASGAATDGGSGVRSHVIQRDETGHTGATCDPFPDAWTDVVAGPVPMLAAINDAAPTGKCYKYRVLATDNVGNEGVIRSSTSVARVDTVAPSGTIDTLPAAISGTYTFSGTALDDFSGFGTSTTSGGYAQLHWTNATDSTSGSLTKRFGPNADPSWTVNVNTTTLTDGAYTFTLEVQDLAGNVVASAATANTIIDNTGPVVTFDSFVEGTAHPETTYWDGASSVLYYNTNGPAGDVEVKVKAVDPETGAASVTFPANGTGWTPSAADVVTGAGPVYTSTSQSFSAPPALANVGARTVVAVNTAGRTSSTANVYELRRDGGISGVGKLAAATGWVTTTSTVVNVTQDPTDTGAGIRELQLEREEVAAPTSGSCSSGVTWPNTFTPIGAPLTAVPVSFTDPDVKNEMCYRYRMRVTDNVDNTAYTAVTGIIRTDQTSPFAAINPPATPGLSGNPYISGTSSDGSVGPQSGVRRVTLRWTNLDDMTTGTVNTDTSAVSAWGMYFDTTTLVDGNYRLHIDVEDNAGNIVVDADTLDLPIDNTPPQITSVTYTPGSACSYWDPARPVVVGDDLNDDYVLWYSNRPGCGAGSFQAHVVATDAPGGILQVEFANSAYAGAGVVPNVAAPYADTTAPYDMTYNYTASAATGSGYNHFGRVVGNSGMATKFGQRFIVDNATPNGQSFSPAPGGITTATRWSNATSVDLAFDPGVDRATTGLPSGLNTWQLKLRKSSAPTTSAGGCAALPALWSDLGTPKQASPMTGITLDDGTCYQFGITSTDNVGNESTVYTAHATNHRLQIDRLAPAGTMVIGPLGPSASARGTITLSGARSDNASGVDKLEILVDGTATPVCGPAPYGDPVVTGNVNTSMPWTCAVDTVALPIADGSHTFELRITDIAGNTFTTPAQTVMVDNTSPTGAVTITPGAGPSFQHLDTSGALPRLWVNTAMAGGFDVESTLVDAHSGPASATFPALGAGWSTTPTGPVNAPGPYEVTYAWTAGAASQAAPGTQSVVLADNAGNTGSASFEVVSDTSAPTGVTLTHSDGPVSTPEVTFSGGSDAESGMRGYQLERRSTAVTGPNTCDTASWSAWDPVGAVDEPSPFQDASVALNNCYQYRIVSTDNVGNEVIVDDPSHTATVEPAGVVITETGGTTAVTEGVPGVQDTYDVRLRTKPAGDVTVAITGDAQVTTVPSPLTLTFTPSNWNVVQTVTVAAVDDDIDEDVDPETGIITNTIASSTDSAYNALTPVTISVAVTDDDTAGVEYSPDVAALEVDEAGATSDTFTVRLTSEPTADVHIDLASADGQVQVSPATAILTPSNWKTGVVVTITAVDDKVDEDDPHDALVTAKIVQGDAKYLALAALPDITAKVHDNDTAGVTITPSSGLTLDEADVATTATYTVQLESEPLLPVTVNVVPDAQVTVTPTSVTFDSSNWSTPVPVVVTVVDDPDFEGPHTGTVSHAIVSGDAQYLALVVPPQVIDITDNDVPGFDVTAPVPAEVHEGGATTTYTIKLKTRPSADVTVAVAAASDIDPITPLVFTTSNWMTPQTVTVVATQDDIDEDSPETVKLVHTITTTDTNYANAAIAPADIDIDVYDDDTAGITLVDAGPAEMSVDETGETQDTFYVKLDSEPTADVVITPLVDAQLGLVAPASPATLTFTPGNWNVPQPVTVKAIDDAVDEAAIHQGVVTLGVASADPKYAPLTAGPVMVDVADNDTAAWVIDPVGTLSVNETGPTHAAYTVRLDSQPATNVVLNLSTPDGQTDVDVASLTFTPANWKDPQTVTVTAVDDKIVETPVHGGVVVQTVDPSSDAQYLLLDPGSKLVDVADNDVPGIDVTPVSLAATEGASADYVIKLTAQPQGTISVALAGDAQVSVAPAGPLTFDETNWNTGHTVTVTAIDDHIDEGPGTHQGTVTHTIDTSGDPLWASLTSVPSVVMDITDNDTAGVTVTPPAGGLKLDETGPTSGTYTVVLDSEPLDDVTISVTPDADATVDAPSLTFTPANWNVAQTVTVTAVDDTIFEGPHTATITHAATSADPKYTSPPLVIDDVVADVTDNDVPGIEVDPAAGPLAAKEGGANGSYKIRLKTEPVHPVTIKFATGSQIEPIADLVLDSSNWSTWATIDVVAVDDKIDEGTPHPGTIVHTIDTTDAGYAPLTIPDMSVEIEDDDTAAIDVDELGGVAVSETGPSSASFTVKLGSEPVAPVTITPIWDAGQVALSGAPALPLQFDATNWNIAQTVTVTAVDDSIDEGSPHATQITFTVAAAGDAKYAAITPDPVDVAINDNDTAGVEFTPALPGPLSVDEEGPTSATYTVVLKSEPVADVHVALAEDTNVSVVGDLVFTSANWKDGQTVTVTAVDDPIVEDPVHDATVAHSVSSSDPKYDQIPSGTGDMQIKVTDNDLPGVEVDDMGGVAVTEGATGGASNTYRVRLTRQPQGDVTVTPTTDPQLVLVSPTAPLLFTSSTWNDWQIVTVEADDDFVDEGPHTGTMTNTVSSADPRWAGVTADPVTVAITDNDTARVIVTHASPYSMAEQTPSGPDATYTVRLASQPTNDVTVTLDIPGDVTASPATLTFTSVNWKDDQTVTFNAIDDKVVEAPIHTRTITHTASSTDPKYTIGAGVIDDVTLEITDNDIPGITVTRTNAVLQLEEGGATDTFDIVLDTQPTHDVTVDLVGTQVGFTPASPITFTPTNWNVAQTITVHAIDDDVDETPGMHAGVVGFAVHSADGIYDGWTLGDIPAEITDNDTAGVTIAPGATPIAVAEAGETTTTYTIKLDSEPTDDVTIAVATADVQTTVDKPSITIAPADWNSPQTVTVKAVDDKIDEDDPHPALVTHTATSTDAHYAGISIDDQKVEVADDDTALVKITPTTGLQVDEEGPTSTTFTVELATQPTADVTVALTTDGQVSLDVPAVTFTPGTWNSAQTVTVTAVDDKVDEDTMTSIIVTETTSTDAKYDQLATDDVEVDVLDNDTAGITITESLGSTDVEEGDPGVTDTYEVVLDTEPTDDVQIAVTGGPQATAMPALLAFTKTNWMTPQTVTVAAVNDFLIEGPHTQLITHVASSSDPKYSGMTAADVTANIKDDDFAGVDIDPTSVTATEDGGTSTYDVKLKAQPTDDVTITIVPDAQVTASAMTLLFTPTNWNDAQTVTVGAVDDHAVEDVHTGTISHTIASSDVNFAAITAISDVTVTITDNDEPGVVVAPTRITASEGGPGGSYDVQLLSKPIDDVTITMANVDGQLKPIAPVTIAPADWNVPHPVNVDAEDDLVDEDTSHEGLIEHDTSSAGDPHYAPGTLTIDDVIVDIDDNDTAAVVVVPTSGLSGGEGDTVSYSIALATQPTANVTVTLAGDADGEVAAPAAPHELVFTPTDWATPKPVDIKLVQDLIAEGAHTTTITHAIASSDGKYAAITVPDQVIDIADDDTAGVVLSPAAPGPLSIDEDGLVATYTLALTSEPTADVTIDLTALAGQATASPASVTFTSANWMNAVPVTIAAIDDAVDEGPHGDTITHVASSSDTFYAGISIGDMTLDIGDNDTAGINVSHVGPDTKVSEDGTLTDTIEVVLNSQPTDDVTVTLAATQVDLAPAGPLTFTKVNWNVPQVIDVTAIDDDVDEGAHTGTVDAATTSTDPKYASLSSATLTVDIDDDDTAGVKVTQPATNELVEATPPGAPITYKVELASEPTAPVDVIIQNDGQITTTPTTLTFTPANWNVAQDVSVQVVDDAAVEAPIHDGVVSHDTTSADPKYGAGLLTIDDVVFKITDNDTPGITITPTTVHDVEEGGVTSSYQIVLESQPTADVTIAPTSSQLEWTVPSITFTPANWSNAQTVTLRAIDDDVAESVAPATHPGTIVHAVTSADTHYTSALASDVHANITDNDVAGYVVNPTSGLAVSEDGSVTASYTIKLTSEPTNDVTVAVATDGLTSVAPASLVFTPSTWAAEQTITVTGVQDNIDRGVSYESKITHAATSADTFYGGTTPDLVTIDVTDDDTAAVDITPTTGLTADEDGTLTPTYDVKLMTEPLGTVTVDVASADGQLAASPATVSFTAADWNVAKQVMVTAVDDDVAESTAPATHAGVLEHTVGGDDAAYDATVTAADVTVDIVDNDVPGVTITPADGTFEVDEDGTISETVTVTLDTKPTAAVDVTLTPDAQLTVDGATTPTTVTLAPGDWKTGVVVPVGAVDDGFIEGPHTGVLTITAVSADPFYTGLAPSTSTASIIDNDTATVTVTQTGTPPETRVAEAGETSDTFAVRLDASPDAGITVTIDLSTTYGSQFSFTPATLVFDETNWSDDQIVTVTAKDDDVDETGTPSYPLSLAINPSSDARFALTSIPDVTVFVDDDDTSDVRITETGGGTAVTEDGATDTFDVQLESEPVDDVTITLTGTNVTTSPATLTFTAATWKNPQTVTVTAIDDDIDQGPDTVPYAGSVTLTTASAGDTTYAGLADLTVDVDVTDDDEAGISVTSAAPIAEAGATSSTVDVHLTSEPTAPITIATAALDGQVTTAPAALTFTPGNWKDVQQVTITAVDDKVQEADPHPGTFSLTASGDAQYDALDAVVGSVDIADDDIAAINVVSSAPFSIDENVPCATCIVTFTLATQPTHDVTIAPAGADGQLVVPDPITFTPVNWATAQHITVTAINDTITEGTHPGRLTFTVASDDPFYAAQLVADIDATIADDDVPTWIVNGADVPTGPSLPAPISLALDESDPTGATFTLALKSAPSTPVTVDLNPGPSTQVQVSPATATFDATNFGDPVTVTVTAIDDADVEGPHAETISPIASGTGPYVDPVNLPLPTIAATIVDNDVAGVKITPTTGLRVEEAGTTSTTFTVELSARPSTGNDVTVSLAEVAATAGQATMAPTSLTFTRGDWNVPQTVTVTAIDDDLAEDPTHQSRWSVTTTSTQAEFNGLAIPELAVDVVDDDVVGLAWTDESPIALTEGDPATHTVQVALTSQPTSPVIVGIAPDGQVSTDVPYLQFDATDWKTPKPFVVSVIDDPFVEGAHTGTIEIEMGGTDPKYAALPKQILTVDITDNDAGGIQLAASTPNPMALTEGGASQQVAFDMLGVSLKDITITAVYDATQLSLSQDSYVVTGGILGQIPYFDVTAIDDDVAEGPMTRDITWTVTSDDPAFNGLVLDPVNVAIDDNDTAGIVVSPTSGLTATEGGAGSTFTVVLSSQPTGPVKVTVDGGSQVRAAGPTNPLTFGPTDWNVPQTVTVDAIDDHDVEGAHSGAVTFQVASTDAMYADPAMVPADLTVAITDNDEAKVIVEPTGEAVVAEGGATGTLTVRLGGRPTANVTVTATPDAQTTVSGPVTFTPANWETPQTFTVTAVQDQMVEGEHTSTITFALESTALEWGAGSAATPSAQTFTVRDDDVAGVKLTETGGSTKVAEGGAGDEYTVELTAQPAADVTIDLEGGTQVKTEPARLTFTKDNWSTPQRVAVNAVQDDIAEANPHPGEVVHRISTTAPGGWTELRAPVLAVSVSDDDSAAIEFAQTDGSTKVAEGGAGDSVTMRLTSQPTADVVITATPDAQLSVSRPITFTRDNWRETQTIEIGAVDDDEVEGDHTGNITFGVASTDELYARQVIPALSVAITDNDKDDSATDGGGEDDDGTDEDQEEEVTPTPPTPPATTRPRSPRSERGAARTERGSRRTQPGRPTVPAVVPQTGGGSVDDAQAGRFKGDPTAQRDRRVRETKSPMAGGVKWLKRNWKLVLPIALLSGLVLGAGTWLARSNPMRAAGGAAGAAGAAGRAARRGAGRSAGAAAERGTGGGRLRGRARKKRDDDEDDEDTSGSK